MYRLLLTNDDGISSVGLLAFYKELSKFARVYVVAPEGPRSAAGLSVTLHKPLRVKKLRRGGRIWYAASGTPGDCVTLALRHIIPEQVNMVCSGINHGENVSLQDFFMSGTVAGAIQAALLGVPAMAFSMRTEKDPIFIESAIEDFKVAAMRAAKMVRFFLENGFPEGIDLINVNFPARVREDTPVRVTTFSRKHVDSDVVERTDPRGRPYFWIWGSEYKSYEPGSDAHVVIEKREISVTFVSLNRLASKPNGRLRELAEKLERL